MAPRTPKITRLDDNAEIYKPREYKTEREKWKELDFRGKVEYFNNYYLAKLIATFVIIGMVVWILVTVFRPKKEEVLSVAMINYPIELEEIDQMTSDMNEILEVDPETQIVTFDTGYDLLNEDVASLQKLSTLLFAGEIDVFIAPESEFHKYAFSESLMPLTELLPTDLLSTLTEDQIFRCKTRLDDEVLPEDALGPEAAYGIYIQDLPMFEYFKKDYISDNPPVIGVIANTENETNCVKFIQYLLDKVKQ
ncbi:MAG: hypothetical protein PUC65_09775 [Clostridiales bacterium]|nr:hypothetical protein [Clostridiales bacterium]